MARSPAPGTRERILGTASRLFYDHGIRAVGTSQIIAEAGTGKNLLYRHFPTKNDLVSCYLARVSDRRRDSMRRALESAGGDPRAQLVALLAEVADLVSGPGFRGCAFRNYLAEFPDDDGSTDTAPARIARGHLAESHATIGRLVGELGVEEPERLTEELWVLVDGLYLQAAYRDRIERQRGTEAAVALAHRLIDR